MSHAPHSSVPESPLRGCSQPAGLCPYFSNGALVVEGKKPKPVHHWATSVNRNDGQGELFLGHLRSPRLLDYHPLPDAPTTWVYTLVALDEDNYPVARVKVFTIVVWRGMPGSATPEDGGAASPRRRRPTPSNKNRPFTRPSQPLTPSRNP